MTQVEVAPERSTAAPGSNDGRMRPGPGTPNAIEVDQLARRFGAIEAVKGVSFEVAEGELFGFLGPNGAGKSTTINMLCTLLHPSGGRATVNGFDVARQRSEVRRSIGLVFQQTTVDEYLSAEQNLRFHAYAYDVPGGGPRPAHPRAARDGRAVGSAQGQRAHLLGRHEAPPGDRARPGPPPQGALPRRADDRPRPPDPAPHLGVPAPPARAGAAHDLPHHPVPGRGRELRPDRDHRPRRDRGARHARTGSSAPSAAI